ncbi:tRNA (guanine-N(7)-)-methyltransferase non-catalytic subunit trm82 [Paramyrothecium foliicola]|nr:tRNA (guanine-N(7)-)-methyltransferase non-catalytic subunit trm82 [Paramyrothecium foliicola]
MSRSSSAVTTGGGGRSSSGVGVRVGDAVLELLDLGPAVLGLNGNRDDLLVRVDKGVEDGRQGREADGQGDGGNGGDSLAKSLQELLLADVENLGGESLALVVDLSNTHTVGEGRDVQHVEQGSLGGADLVASLNELEVGGNFNGTTGDLGGDTESLEERGLTRLHTGVASGNPDVGGSEGTSTGRGGDTVGQDLVTDLLKVGVGEDETDVALDVRQEALVLGSIENEGPEGTTNLVKTRLAADRTLAGCICRAVAYHGVLAHQDNSLTTEGVSDLVHLLRADIVDGDDENGLVVLQQALQLVEVAGLVLAAPHIFLFLKAGYLRAGLLVCGDVVFAARGGNLHSFSLQDGTHISTWQHPDVAKVAEAVKAIEEGAKTEDVSSIDPSIAPTADDDEPPAKRQKVAEDALSTEKESSAAPEPTEGAPEDAGSSVRKGKGKKSKKKKQGSEQAQAPRVPERPVIAHLASTEDGSHVLAVSGHDKTIWVFTHDGKGNLTQYSQRYASKCNTFIRLFKGSNKLDRAMPKRPSAVHITSEGQILSADKFGDVYSLPLLGTIYSQSDASGIPRSSTPQAVAKARSKIAANTFTVHSKRNLEALVNQQKELELATRTKGEVEEKNEGPNFELTLQLGHVSMLTAVMVGVSDNRRYIISADRDEHIRVSRYIPQAHIIEGFCLGHKEFIADITIPSSRPDVLVSGGGDEEIFVWDWKAGSVSSKKSILSLAQEIVPETTKVAVAGLYSFTYTADSETLTYILAICEGIKAIFSWQLTPENTLNHPSIIQLPGNPLHLTLYKPSGAAPTIIAAVDPGEGVKAKSLHVFRLTQTEGRIAVDTDTTVRDDALEADEPEVTEDVVRSLLYTTESLRKQTSEAEAEVEEDEAQVTPSETA